MIYNQKHAIFVALAGLFTSASAAPAHHAKSGHTSELVSPGLTEPEKMWTRGVTKEDYPEACMKSWEMFNMEKCWCFTGCALDCNHGGWKVDPRRGKAAEPGVRGKDLNPEMCEGLTDADKEACGEPTCDLVANCKDISAELAPGLDKIESTGSYDCAALSPGEPAGDDSHVAVYNCFKYNTLFMFYPVDSEEAKYWQSFIPDGKTSVGLAKELGKKDQKYEVSYKGTKAYLGYPGYAWTNSQHNNKPVVGLQWLNSDYWDTGKQLQFDDFAETSICQYVDDYKEYTRIEV